VLATVTLAQKTVLVLLWPSLIVIALTVLFGRVFCSWICPLGTLIDMAGHFSRPDKKQSDKQQSDKKNRVHLRYLKYALLLILLISSCFGVQLLGFADPFSLLVRGMVFAIDPVFNFLVSGFFDSIYVMGPALISDKTEVFYDILKAFVLPYKQSFFYLSFVSFFLLVMIFVMEFFSNAWNF
jgi:polyferredoxin